MIITKKTGLGKQFYNKIDKHLDFLKENYLSFAVRYDEIRCMPVKKFPYMIPFQSTKKPANGKC